MSKAMIEMTMSSSISVKPEGVRWRTARSAMRHDLLAVILAVILPVILPATAVDSLVGSSREFHAPKMRSRISLYSVEHSINMTDVVPMSSGDRIGNECSDRSGQERSSLCMKPPAMPVRLDQALPFRRFFVPLPDSKVDLHYPDVSESQTYSYAYRSLRSLSTSTSQSASH